MAIGPGINTNVRSISFPICSTDASPIYTMATLAASTGGIVYQTGLLLAQYTSSGGWGTAGQFVNYDSVAGAHGQQTFVGVLMDDLIVTGTTVTGQVQIAVWLTKGAFVQEQLFYTQIADIAAAIAQRDAKVVFDFNASPATHLIYGL